MTPQCSTFTNGLKVITEKIDYLDSISLGFWIKAGTKDEPEQRLGISHFIEHLLFKGTKNRTATQIVQAIESLGGAINAFTDKEYTCYYVKVLKEHLEVALDVLSDMLINPLLHPQSIEIEKNVILQEIKRHEDTPEELIHDLFAQTIWANHPLGKTGLGTPETIKKFNREIIASHMKNFYTPDNIIIAAAGNLEHERLLEAVEKFHQEFVGTRAPSQDSTPQVSANCKIFSRDTEEVHLCFGTKGYSQTEDDKYALAILDNVLGEGMSSRLFREIREHRGLAYSIGSCSVVYKTAGFFSIYAGTVPQNLLEVIRLIKSEFENIKKQGISPEELQTAKNCIKGALILGLESTDARMTRLARSTIYFDRVIPIQEILDKIYQVSLEDVLRVANEILQNNLLNLVLLGPIDQNQEEKFKEIIYS